MFIDEALIYVRSGRGGNGMVHFLREKYVPRGGPDGGDGGRGGDVIFEVVPTLNTLQSFRFKRKYIAESGANGGSTNKTGKSAPDLIIPVPPERSCMTQIPGEILADLTHAGERVVVCKGGRGGKGNQHYATSRNQAPRMAEKANHRRKRIYGWNLNCWRMWGLLGFPMQANPRFFQR